MRLAGFSTGINFNPDILNGGTPCAQPNCGSWEYIPGSRDALLNGLVSSNFQYQVDQSQLKINGVLATGFTSNDVQPGAYNLGRYRFTNTVPWTQDTDAQLWLQPNNTGGSSNSSIGFYPYGAITPVSICTTTTSGASVSLGYTQANPFFRVLNSSLATSNAAIEPVTAYPNPFSDSFKLNLGSFLDKSTNVKIYDMLGRLVENNDLETNVVHNSEFGTVCRSGIYNVVVSQSEKTQVIRLLKQ